MATSLNAKEKFMRKFRPNTIQNVLDCAIKVFVDNKSAPEIVNFSYKGHFVNARIKWSKARLSYYVANFIIVYSNCSMMYFAGSDYDISSALCK